MSLSCISLLYHELSSDIPMGERQCFYDVDIATVKITWQVT